MSARLNSYCLSQKWKNRVLILNLNGKRLYPSKSVKYLGIKIDGNLTWIDHIIDTAIKLNRANAVLFKIREFVSIKILKSIYYAIFDCHLNCANTVWGQDRYSMNRLIILQRKALHIISFECRNAHLNPLFFKDGIIKLPDKIMMENCLFISKSINFNLLSISITGLLFLQTHITMKPLALQKVC